MADRQTAGTAPEVTPLEAGGTYQSAEALLRSLREHGVEYVFANLGTDHTPILEAEARLRESGAVDAVPQVVACPHEFLALSVAHGYAASTGDPQAVLVHVDVGTQNLGGAVHNAHRANVPVFVISGLAPVTDAGHAGSRDHSVHYVQDVFDQPGILREYARWTTEYRPPADPDAIVARGLTRAQSTPPGPVYLTATREALETDVTVEACRSVEVAAAEGASAETVEELADRIRAADAPLVVTSGLGRSPARSRVDALVAFAEAAGAGVVEHSPTTLNFPRDHELHAGFSPTRVFDEADLVILADTDVPWVPADGRPDAPVVQIDPSPSKSTYPHWDYHIDRAIDADAAATLAAVAERVEGDPGPWPSIHDTQHRDAAETVAAHRDAGRFTPAVLSDALNAVVDDETVVVEDIVTSRPAFLAQVPLSEPGSYFHKGGAGLGWAPGAGVGVKLARPDRRVVTLAGDGAYIFSNPTASTWLARAEDAPTLTVIYDNQGWNAVKESTLGAHPDGAADRVGVAGSRFDPPIDLSAPATAVDAYTATVEDEEGLTTELEAAVAAVEGGTPAVIDARIEPV